MSDFGQIQLQSIDVPYKTPFKNYLLARDEFVEAIASTLAGTQGSAVFAIDGRWGSGKTIFAQMLSCVLKRQKFRVVSINAWDTDYTDDPLGALTHALHDAMGSASRRRKQLKEAVAALMREVVVGTVRLASGGLVSGDELTELAKKRFDAFQERTKAMHYFQELLRDIAADGDRPLVVIVDELDRCRPTYAVEMLETIKHVFHIERILFVLTVNRVQLDRSAGVLYGSSSDPESYFSRFDVEVSLPEGTGRLPSEACCRGPT